MSEQSLVAARHASPSFNRRMVLRVAACAAVGAVWVVLTAELVSMGRASGAWVSLGALVVVGAPVAISRRSRHIPRHAGLGS